MNGSPFIPDQVCEIIQVTRFPDEFILKLSSYDNRGTEYHYTFLQAVDDNSDYQVGQVVEISSVRVIEQISKRRFIIDSSITPQ